MLQDMAIGSGIAEPVEDEKKSDDISGEVSPLRIQPQSWVDCRSFIRKEKVVLLHKDPVDLAHGLKAKHVQRDEKIRNNEVNFKGDPMKEQGPCFWVLYLGHPNEWKALHQMRGLNEDCLKGRDQPTDRTETTNGTLQATKGKAKEHVRRVVKREKGTRNDLHL